MKRASFTAATVLCLCALISWALPSGILISAAIGLVLCGISVVFFLRFRSLFLRDLVFITASLAISMLILWFPVTESYATADRYSGTEATLTVRLTEDPVYTSGGSYRYTVRPADGSFPQKFCFFSPVYYTEAGGTLTATFSFERPAEDYAESNLGNGIILTAVLKNLPEEVQTSEPNLSFYSVSGSVRRYVHKVFLRYIGGDEAGFMTAVLTGNKQALSDGDYTALAETGMLHIVAVSGLHVSIFVSFALFFLRKIRIPWLKFVLSVLSLFVILLFSGFTPSVCRAVIMSAVLFLDEGFLLGSDPLNRLGIAAIVIVLIAPHSVLSLSFQLSFAAALGILLFSRTIQNALTQWLFVSRHVICGTVLRNAVSLFAVSLASFTLTLPILWLRLNEFSVWSLILSPVVLPVLQICFTVALVLLILALFPFFGTVCPLFGVLIRYGVIFMTFLSSSAADLVGAVRGISPLLFWIILIAVVVSAVFLFLLPGLKTDAKREKKKKIRYGVSLLVFAVALLSAYQVANQVGDSIATGNVSPGEGVLQTAFLDVGQGNCFVSVLDGQACVVDCGGTKDPGHVASDYLTSVGVDTVEFVLISHLHSDHANGLKELCEEKEILEIIIPTTEGEASLLVEIRELAETEGAILTELTEDTERNLGNATVRMLTKHLDETADDQNENSIVGLCEYGNFKVLFTGDITKSAEKRLINAYGNGLRCDVLSVPHHGSKGSSSKEFVSITSPVYAVVSVGKKNTYGHPSAEALERICDVGAEVLRTDERSTVIVRSDGNKVQVVNSDES